jgi:hypothetical protein
MNEDGVPEMVSEDEESDSDENNRLDHDAVRATLQLDILVVRSVWTVDIGAIYTVVDGGDILNRLWDFSNPNDPIMVRLLPNRNVIVVPINAIICDVD